MMKIKAFNLSEVLIALTIITVVGVLTISTVTTNFKKASYVAGLKEADRLISDAAGLIMRENGGSLVGTFSDSDDMMNKFATKMSVQKTCLANEKPGVCWHNGTSSYKALDGSAVSWMDDPNVDARAILNNGFLLWFTLFSTNCSNSDFSMNGENGNCGVVRIDVNGFNAPNKVGRDIFDFQITKFGVYPNGTSYSNAAEWDANCNPLNTGYEWGGIACAARVINEGGMNY